MERLLRQIAEGLFGPALDREGGPFQLDRVEIARNDWNRSYVISAYFHGCPPRNYEVEDQALLEISPRAHLTDGHSYLIDWLERQYSRMFEDVVLNREIRIQRDLLLEIQRTTNDRAVLQRATENYHRMVEHIRRHHVRRADRVVNPPLFVGLDRGAPEGDFTAVNWAQPIDADLLRVELPRQRNMTATEVRARQDAWEREYGPRLARSWQRLAERAFHMMGAGGDIGTEEAQARGLALLRENLTPKQRKQYDEHQWFEVVGSDSGKRYRIYHGRQMNIHELDKKGQHAGGVCFLPQGNLVAGDCMLAQKIALETNEKKALKIANRFL